MLDRTLRNALTVGLLALGVSSLGCSSLGRGGLSAASAASDDSSEEEEALPAAGNVAQGADTTLPGQQEVTWTDNGIPIRQLTGPGRPQEMKVPESHPKKPAQPKLPAPSSK